MLSKNLFSYRNCWMMILLLALLLRLSGLSLNPIGLNHDDELQELINAKSLATIGQPSNSMAAGIFGGSTNCQGNCIYGELGSYILIPWMLIFPLSIFWSKIPFVFMSVLIVYFTGKLFENISKNRNLGLVSALIVAINPWAIHFGRTAYLTTFSYTFYLLAAFIYTRNKSYKSNLFYGTIISALASLFYFGTKPILPFIVLWGILYNIYYFKKLDIKFSLLIVAICASFMAIYLSLLTQSFAGRRTTEVGLFGQDIVTLVNQERRVSLNIPLIRDIFINKYTIPTRITLDRVMGAFSPSFLYVQSVGSTDLYYTSNHGYNYLVDLPFLIFGIAGMGLDFSSLFFILSLLVTAVFPGLVKTGSDTLYAFRVGLAYPILSGITGWGIYYLYQKTIYFQKKNKLASRFALNKIYITAVILIYSTSLIYFMTMYWYRVPIEKSAGWYFHKRVLASYITRIIDNSSNKIAVFTVQPADTFNTFIFYSGAYNNRQNITDINIINASQDFVYRNISFMKDCNILGEETKKGTIIFVEQGTNCNLPSFPSMKIANPRDSGGLYDIYNESLCKNYPKNKYPYPRNIHDFQVEKLTDEQFCTKWITDPDNG